MNTKAGIIHRAAVAAAVVPRYGAGYYGGGYGYGYYGAAGGAYALDYGYA